MSWFACMVLRCVATSHLPRRCLYRAFWCRHSALWLSECAVRSPECTADSGRGRCDRLAGGDSGRRMHRRFARAETVSLINAWYCLCHILNLPKTKTSLLSLHIVQGRLTRSVYASFCLYDGRYSCCLTLTMRWNIVHGLVYFQTGLV